MLAAEISGAPGQGNATLNSSPAPVKDAPQQKTHSRRKGLFLRFDSADDPRIKKAGVIISIFEGPMPTYFYYKDKKHYELQKSLPSAPNNTMLSELRRLLGEENVALIE